MRNAIENAAAIGFLCGVAATVCVVIFLAQVELCHVIKSPTGSVVAMDCKDKFHISKWKISR
jgi:hypothetical protein